MMLVLGIKEGVLKKPMIRNYCKIIKFITHRSIDFLGSARGCACLLSAFKFPDFLQPGFLPRPDFFFSSTFLKSLIISIESSSRADDSSNDNSGRLRICCFRVNKIAFLE